jgi:tetratricopeptide (TPR) repeat protein
MQVMPEYIKATYEGETKGDYALKAKIALDGIADHPDEAEYGYAYAVCFYGIAKLYDEAIELGRKMLPILTIWDCKRDVFNTLIRALEETGKQKEAMEVRLQESEEDPTGSDYEAIAKAYKEMGDKAKSIEYYERYVEECDNVCETETFTELSDLYESIGDYENSAKHLLQAARDQCNESAWLWCNTGRALALAGKEDKAKIFFEFVLQIDPAYAYAHYMIGQIFQNKGDSYRALHHYTEALKTQPKFPEVYNNLGSLSFNEDGDIKAAISYMEQALTMNPGKQLLTALYINLVRLNKQISEYDRQEYYQAKVLQSVGFPVEFGEGDEDEEEDDDGLV